MSPLLLKLYNRCLKKVLLNSSFIVPVYAWSLERVKKKGHLLKMKEGIPRCILCVMLGNISMVTVKAVTLVKLPESISVDQFPTAKDRR